METYLLAYFHLEMCVSRFSSYSQKFLKLEERTKKLFLKKFTEKAKE